VTLSKLLIRDRELVSTLLKIENEAEETPLASAITTLVAFLAFGIVPLLASLIFASVLSPFVSSSIWTLLTLFALGWFKAQWTHQKPLVAGAQMAALGGTSSFIAYIIANLLSGFNSA
jgi:VIT1/CCC1 family predicted Fe2+/Mn2+ transporter